MNSISISVDISVCYGFKKKYFHVFPFSFSGIAGTDLFLHVFFYIFETPLTGD